MKKLIAIIAAVLCILSLALPVFAEDQYTELCEVIAIVAEKPDDESADHLVYKYIFKVDGDPQEFIDSGKGAFETWWGIGEKDEEDPSNCSMCHAAFPADWYVEGNFPYKLADLFDPEYLDAGEEWDAVLNGGMVGYVCELTGNTGYPGAPVTEKDGVVMDAKGRHTNGIKANTDMTSNQYSFGGPYDALVLTVIPEVCFNYQTGEISAIPEDLKPAETEPKATEAPAATEAPKTTEAPAATEAPASTDDPAATNAPSGTKAAEEKKGCGSALASLALIPTLLAAAYVTKKH